MIDVVIVKKGMVSYVQDVRALIGMGRGLRNHHVILCKVRLVGTWKGERCWLGVEVRNCGNNSIEKDMFKVS